MIKRPLLAAARLQLAVTLVVFAHGAAAQGSGSVVESRPFTPGQTQSSSSQSVAPNSDALSLLLEQNRQLQAEVQALRGLVEEQGFEIRKLQRDSLSRYTNVDQRLTNLESAPPQTPAISQSSPGTTSSSALSSTAAETTETTIGNRPSIPASTPPTRTSGRSLGRGTLQPAVLSEQQLYQMAYDSVINSNFELSIAEFDQYLSVYPDGRFITNAHYWKGQAYLYLSRFEEARDSYEIILNQYSDSAKLPDAMYGLGLAYQGLGNISRAKQLLNDIKRRFPNTGVANLADTRLLSLD